MKRLAMVLICIVFLALLTISGKAEGLEIRVESDKDRYEANDVASIFVYVENRTRKTVKNINVLHHLPEGLVYAETADSSEAFIPELASGEKAQIRIDVKKEKPRLDVQIVADKNIYGNSDVAELTIRLENTTDIPLKNLDLTHVLPNGLVYARGSSGQIRTVDELGAYETAEVKLYVKKAVLPPETGDCNSPVLIWLSMAFAAGITFVWLARRKGEI